MNDILDTAATSGPREQADLRFARATVSPAAMAPRRSGSQALPGELVFHPCVPEHMECSTQVELSESEAGSGKCMFFVMSSLHLPRFGRAGSGERGEGPISSIV